MEGWIKGATRSHDSKTSKPVPVGGASNNNNNNNSDAKDKDSGLPEGWTEHLDPGTNRTYYYHHPTQVALVPLSLN